VLNNLANKLYQSQLWKSIFRHGLPNTPKNQSLVTFTNVFLHLHSVKVKERTLRFDTTYWLGGISLMLFGLLTLTGIILMLYYVPSTTQAYENMKDLAFAVSFGDILRNMHRWSAHLMVLFVFLHMCRVFWSGAYKAPREFNWVIGVFLFLFTLLLSFTGYLLPWDQLAIWAITVGSNMAKYAPFVGPDIKFALLGGNAVGQNALIRFYVLHCVIFPLVVAVLLAVHFWRIRKDGGLADPGDPTSANVLM
jgi:quinol-cytochrome oxidoreductase complex cytochrome b subunit